jgi:hypothetical protein
VAGCHACVGQNRHLAAQFHPHVFHLVTQLAAGILGNSATSVLVVSKVGYVPPQCVMAPCCLHLAALRLHHRFGSIGQRVAQLARAYEMRVLALRRQTTCSQADLDSGLLVRAAGLFDLPV